MRLPNYAFRMMAAWLNTVNQKVKKFKEVIPMIIDLTQFLSKERPVCPHCGSKKTLPLVYDKVVYPGNLEEDLDNGLVALASQPLGPESPHYFCWYCENEFGRDPEMGTVDYLHQTNRITYTFGYPGANYMTLIIQKTQSGAEVISYMDGVSHSLTGKEDQWERIKNVSVALSQAEWDQLMDTLFHKAYVHDWPAYYCAQKPSLLDVHQNWKLTIEVEGQEPKVLEGMDSFPPLWHRVMEVMDAYWEKALELRREEIAKSTEVGSEADFKAEFGPEIASAFEYVSKLEG